jgi:hypothetical protein
MIVRGEGKERRAMDKYIYMVMARLPGAVAPAGARQVSGSGIVTIC